MPKQILCVLLVAIVVATLAKTFLIQSFYIPSDSMEPTLNPKDKILVQKWGGEIRRGDVMVFKDPGGWLPPADLNVFQKVLVKLNMREAKPHLVKRVVGLPGDTVECCSTDGRLLVNGVPLEESYLPRGMEPSELEFRVELPEDKYWVMGDNRSESADSRFHLGELEGDPLVDREDFVGEVVGVFWPFSRFSLGAKE